MAVTEVPGSVGPPGPQGESAPIPDFAGYYETMILNHTFYMFLGVDQFFAIFKEFGENDPRKGTTILWRSGYYSWSEENFNTVFLFFRSNLYDISGNESYYVYNMINQKNLRQVQGEPLFEDEEDPVEISQIVYAYKQ